jgi:hypothetical protein
MPGIAEILPDDDALARQRRIVGWHPLRALNAMNVRVLGTDLLTVRVQLLPDHKRVSKRLRSAPDTSNSQLASLSSGKRREAAAVPIRSPDARARHHRRLLRP